MLGNSPENLPAPECTKWSSPQDQERFQIVNKLFEENILRRILGLKAKLKRADNGWFETPSGSRMAHWPLVFGSSMNDDVNLCNRIFEPINIDKLGNLNILGIESLLNDGEGHGHTLAFYLERNGGVGSFTLDLSCCDSEDGYQQDQDFLVLGGLVTVNGNVEGRGDYNRRLWKNPKYDDVDIPQFNDINGSKWWNEED